MLAPLAALIGIGRFNARNEPSFLLDVLREALEALGYRVTLEPLAPGPSAA